MSNEKENEKEQGNEKPKMTPEEARLVAGIYSNMIRPLESEIMRLRSQVDALNTRTPSNIKKIESVEDFLKENKLAIVDFFSEHCMPCHKMTPALEIIAGEDNGVVVGKVDIDDFPDEADKYDVKSIPLILSYRDGQVVQESLGAPSDPSDAIDLLRSMASRLQVSDEDFEKTLEVAGNVADKKGWELNPDDIALTNLITSLTVNKLKDGKPYCPCKTEKIKENVCPCRAVEDKYESAEDMIAEQGFCYCGLFVSKEKMKEIESEDEQ